MTITIPVKIDCNAPSGQLDPNTAIINTPNTDPITVVEPEPPLITGSPDFGDGAKTSTPSSIYSGQQITYTLTATNTGTSISANFTVTDTLPIVNLKNGMSQPVTLDVSSVKGYYNGQQVDVLVGGTLAVPTFTLVDSNKTPIPIPVGAKVKITLTVTVPKNAITPQKICNNALIEGSSNVLTDQCVKIKPRPQPKPDCHCCNCCCQCQCRCCSCNMNSQPNFWNWWFW